MTDKASKVQEEALKSFKRSLDRLNRLIALEAPAVIICHEVIQTEERAWLAFGTDMDLAMGERRREAERRRLGFCQSCDNSAPPDEDYCAACLKRFEEADDDEADPDLN